MRAGTLFIIVFALSSNLTNAQPNYLHTWYSEPVSLLWLNGISVSIAAESTVYVAGGNVCRTIDNGATWQVSLAQPDPSFPFSGVKFVSASIGFATSGTTERQFYKTVDGGETWNELQFNFDPYPISPLRATDSLHAFQVGLDSRVHYTTDGGLTWQASQTSFSGLNLGDIFFLDSLVGWVVTRRPGNYLPVLYKTTNGAQSWQAVSEIELTGFSWEITFANESVGIISNIGSDLYRTSDGGMSWHHVYSDSDNVSAGTVGLQFLTDSLAYALNRPGKFLKSCDHGITWLADVIEELGDYEENFHHPEDMEFRDSLNGVLLLYGGDILTTSDGGETWSTFDPHAYPNFVAMSPSQNELWLLDDQNSVWRRSELGGFWRRSFFPDEYRMNDMFALDDSTAWAVGDSGVIVSTIDGGSTWIESASPTSLNLYDLAFSELNPQRGYACGDSGVILLSTNGGLDWQIVSIGETGRLNSLGNPYNHCYWCVGDSGAVKHSPDGGLTWETLPPPTVEDLFGVNDDGTVLVYGEAGTWLTTNNNGQTWASDHFTDADVVGYAAWWGAGYPRMIVCSNGEYYCGPDCDYSINVDFSDVYTSEHHFVACGEAGFLARMELIHFDVPEQSEELPQLFSLSAYPNPFNSTATLQFNLPRQAKVEIVLYDILGREAMRLADNIYTSGTHRVLIDAAPLSSGVYFANLSSPEYSNTVKLLLLR